MAESAMEVVERLRGSQGQIVKMLSLFHCATFDVIGKAGFGVDFGAVVGKEPPVWRSGQGY